jgi:probable addiction module antidote protein
MAERFRRFDAADYLETPEDIQAYLDAAAEDGDPAALAAALGAVARARNMAQLARETGMTREGLYKALSPGGNPAFATVAKVARVLGYELAFRPVGQKPAPMKRASGQPRDLKQKGAA